MRILALDSSGLVATVAIVEDEQTIAEYTVNYKKTHSQTLLPMLDEIRSMIEMDLGSIDAIAIAAGPGSFTGLRIGIGTVKGMAFAAGKPCCAVTSFEALAEAAKTQADTILTVLDARQKRVYCAAFRVENGIPVQVMEDSLLPIAQLEEALREAGIVCPYVVGDAAVAVCAALGENAVLSDETHRDIHAAAAACAAARKAQAGGLCSASQLRPGYLQLSQAERNLQKN